MAADIKKIKERIENLFEAIRDSISNLESAYEKETDSAYKRGLAEGEENAGS